ncbi:STAS domain-containing protein [Nocardioides mangrovi]|uniref:STAS domain-containing protein n=1 Tax=Nocardioides mangrovi TaxID=2874580 RepID=A0ABS7UID6_9ACTN|nr:STAS domain-containing protein [Nocardioides mangrovi]MBZ5740647.1 STAS domain-containing protein [Nocardioides mangrovi]
MVPAADGASAPVVVPLTDDGLTEVLDDLDRRLDVALTGGPRAVVLDLATVTEVSSTTIAALLWARRRCSSRGVAVVVRHPTRRCRDTLERVGLLRVLILEQPTSGGTSARLSPGTQA